MRHLLTTTAFLSTLQTINFENTAMAATLVVDFGGESTLIQKTGTRSSRDVGTVPWSEEQNASFNSGARTVTYTSRDVLGGTGSATVSVTAADGLSFGDYETASSRENGGPFLDPNSLIHVSGSMQTYAFGFGLTGYETEAQARIGFFDTIKINSSIATTVELPFRIEANSVVAESFGEPIQTSGEVEANVTAVAGSSILTATGSTDGFESESISIFPIKTATDQPLKLSFNVEPGETEFYFAVYGNFEAESEAVAGGSNGFLAGAATSGLWLPGSFEIGHFTGENGSNLDPNISIVSADDSFDYVAARTAAPTPPPIVIPEQMQVAIEDGNLISNGDFENGDTGFESDLRSDISLTAPSSYRVANDPKSFHRSFGSFSDITDGGENMLVINGSTGTSEVVWRQTLSLLEGQAYDLSFFLTSAFPANPGLLDVYAGDFLLGSVTAPKDVGFWEQYAFSFLAPEDSTILSFVNRSTAFGGNDFALDNISLFQSDIDAISNFEALRNSTSPSPVPIPAGFPLLLTGLGGVFLLCRRKA